MIRRYYESRNPQTTFVQNQLGKNVQVSNDSDSFVDARFGDVLMRMPPGALEYLVMHDEAPVTFTDSHVTHGPYYTRSDANCVSIRRDAAGRLLPVYYFTRF